MKKIISTLSLVTLLFLAACNNGEDQVCFKTQEDSLKFARAVMSKYADSLAKNESINWVDASQKMAAAPLAAPLPWDSVVKYANAHDASPLFRIGGNPTKGLMVDENGLNYVRGLDQRNYTKLYLRFGKKSNGDYTVILLPVKPNGEIEKIDNRNYDHLDPCPSSCPTNFE